MFNNKIANSSDFCCSIFDGTHDSPKYKEIGYPLVTSKYIDDLENLSNAPLISKDDFDKINIRSAVKINDVLISLIGTVGNTNIIKLPPTFAIKNIGVLRCKNTLDAYYLYYYLNSPFMQNYIKKSLVGSTQQFLSLTNLRNLPIKEPINDNFKQHIVNTIGSVDDLIENYQKRIKKIRNLRKLIFLYTVSNASEYKKVSDLIKLENGAQPPKSEHIYEEKSGYIRFIQNRDYTSHSHLTFIKKSKNNHICYEDDILIDKYGDAGAVRYGLYGAFNVALLKVIPINEYLKEFLRDYLSQDKIRNILCKSSRASTRSSLNSATFIGLKIPMINDKELRAYNEKGKKLLNYELILNKKIEKLKLLKNLLLSKYFK